MPAPPPFPAVPPATRLSRAVLQLACPSACAVCGEPGAPACARCLVPLRAAPRWHRPDPAPAGLPPVLTVAEYSGGVRDLITAWKERGHRALAAPLAEVLATAVTSSMLRPLVGQRHDEPPPMVLVPMPSSRASRRHRGEDAWGRVVALATRRIAESAQTPGSHLAVARCLRLVRQPHDQAGLSATARMRNLSGAMTCAHPPAVPVLLVDDVITTGATIAEAARCLTVAGVPVRAAVTLAATPRTAASGRRRRGSTLSP